MIAISLIDANDFSTNVIIESQTYRLHFSWNDRIGQWFFDWVSQDGKPIVRGVAVHPNFPLLTAYRRLEGPEDVRGQFIAVAANPNNLGAQSIGRKDFVSGKFKFLYLTKKEVDVILQTSI